LRSQSLPPAAANRLHRSSPRTSPRSSACWSQGYLQSVPGRNLDGTAGCSSARNVGWNPTSYVARNRTRSSSRCLRSSGRSSGGSSVTSSLRRSSRSSSDRYFGSYADSYGGGIGGVSEGILARDLGLRDLGRVSPAGGMCSIIHIWTRARTQFRPSSGVSLLTFGFCLLTSDLTPPPRYLLPSVLLLPLRSAALTFGSWLLPSDLTPHALPLSSRLWVCCQTPFSDS